MCTEQLEGFSTLRELRDQFDDLLQEFGNVPAMIVLSDDESEVFGVEIKEDPFLADLQYYFGESCAA